MCLEPENLRYRQPLFFYGELRYEYVWHVAGKTHNLQSEFITQ